MLLPKPVVACGHVCACVCVQLVHVCVCVYVTVNQEGQMRLKAACCSLVGLAVSWQQLMNNNEPEERQPHNHLYANEMLDQFSPSLIRQYQNQAKCPSEMSYCNQL